MCSSAHVLRRGRVHFILWPFTPFSRSAGSQEHRTEGWKEEKWILHQPHLYLRQTGLENSFNFSQTHPLIWTGHVISLSIHPTCSGHKFSFSSPGRSSQVAVSCGFKPQQGPLNSAPESASTGLFLSGWHMLRRFNFFLQPSRYVPGGRNRTSNRSWWMWRWATEAETERSN